MFKIPLNILVLFSLLLPHLTSAQVANTTHEAILWKQYRGSKDSSYSVTLLISLSEEIYKRDRLYSEKIAEHAYLLSKLTGESELKVKALIRLINVSFDNGNNIRANALAPEIQNITSESFNKFYKSEAYRIAGRNHHFRGEYPDALKNYFNGLRLSEELGDTIQMGEFYNLIGGIYYNQEDVKNAWNYFNKSLLIQIKKNNKLRIGRGYLNTGSTYLLTKEFKKARVALDSSLLNYALANFEEGKAMVYTTLPQVFINSGEKDSAFKYLEIAYNYLKEKNKTFYVTQVDIELAKLYIAKNDFKNALIRINDGIAFGLGSRQNHDLATLYQLKAEVLDQTGQSKEALKSYKLYKQYSDSIINAASIKKQTEEALNYEYNRKEYQQQLEAAKKETRKNWLIAGSIFISVIVFLVLYYRYRLKQKANRLLEHSNFKLAEKNQLIEEKSQALQESLNERELLLKEIHHRVKNNLQVISGLLELQKEELTEDGSKAAFDEGQSRIRSISLIHQNLYQNEKLGSIKFKTFVLELTEQVKEVFEQNDQAIQVQINMPDHILDIDTAVPLGLILNELLTNSYKYAAGKNKPGLIEITLEEFSKGQFLLKYSDNGPGIKKGTDFDSANTLGLRLIRGLAAQLSGKAVYKYNNGATFEIHFKDTKARMGD